MTKRTVYEVSDSRIAQAIAREVEGSIVADIGGNFLRVFPNGSVHSISDDECSDLIRDIAVGLVHVHTVNR